MLSSDKNCLSPSLDTRGSLWGQALYTHDSQHSLHEPSTSPSLLGFSHLSEGFGAECSKWPETGWPYMMALSDSPGGYRLASGGDSHEWTAQVSVLVLFVSLDLSYVFVTRCVCCLMLCCAACCGLKAVFVSPKWSSFSALIHLPTCACCLVLQSQYCLTDSHILLTRPQVMAKESLKDVAMPRGQAQQGRPRPGINS